MGAKLGRRRGGGEKTEKWKEGGGRQGGGDGEAKSGCHGTPPDS